MIGMNKKIRNVISVTTAALLATTAIGYSVLTNNEKTVSADNTETKEKLENTINDSIKFTTIGDDKEETVYIIADADGNVTKTIVSDWLKNKDGSATINDKSDLKNIENVKSDADYEEGTDGNIIWSANGEDVYYQGETDKELPVDMKITYYLNDKEVSASQIAGKSGKVKIRFDYTNHEKKDITVDGKHMSMYVPFTMISGLVLDTDTFSNVEINSGKVISDGNRMIAVGLAFPGLNDNLGLQDISKELDTELSFPEYVEITADTTEFSLGLTLTMGSADLLSKISTTSVESLDDLKDMLDSLVSATDELKSGTESLEKGIGELQNSFKEYAAGVKTLVSGLTEINSGVAKLDASTPQLTDGTKSLLDGIDTIITKVSGDGGAVNGAKQLADGASKLDAGIGTLKDKSTDLVNGVGQLADGANSVETNMQTVIQAFEGTESQMGLADGSQAVADGVAELATQLSGMVSTINAAIADNNSKMEQCQAGLETCSTKMAECEAAIADCESKITQCETGIEQCKAVIAGGISPTTGGALTEEEIAGYNEKIEDLTGNISDLEAGIQTANEGKATIEATQKELEGNIQTLTGANLALNNILSNMDAETMMRINALQDGANSVADGVKRAGAGVKQLESEGTSKLAEGLSQLNGQVPELGSGIDELKAGSAQVASGANELAAGLNVLSDGLSSSLRPGVDKLYQGGLLFKSSISQLYAGTSKAASGGNELNTATDKVTSGISQLYDGSVKLDDGMGRFKEEAIDKISDFVKNDLEDLLDRIKATIDAAGEYTIFSDAAEGKSTSVKFIYETAAVATD